VPRIDHTSHERVYKAKIVHFSNEEGSVQIEFCKSCGQVLSTICEHVKNTWRDISTDDLENIQQALICNLCGADGT
jgi:hypothetical protein